MATGTAPVAYERRQVPDGVYREILWRLPEGVVVLQVDDPADLGAARIISANPAALRLHDPTSSPNQVIGRTVREAVFPHLLNSEHLDIIAEVVRTRVPQELGYLPVLGHPERTYAVRVFPLPGNCVGVEFEDVSHVQALVEAEDRVTKTLRASPLGMCLIKLDDGELLDANGRFLELFGFARREELVGKRVHDLGMWAGAREYKRLVNELREQGEIREAPLVCHTRYGRTFRALVALEAVTFEGDECVLVMFWRT